MNKLLGKLMPFCDDKIIGVNEEKARLSRKRYLFLMYAQAFIGTPYMWGGDDPMRGFDCSGFVIEALKAVGYIKGKWTDMTADTIWNSFKEDRVDMPYEGCLVFFGEPDERVSHIEICLDNEHAIGASGGGSRTTTLNDAIKQNAYIMVRPIQRPRNIIGYIDVFKRLPR